MDTFVHHSINDTRGPPATRGGPVTNENRSHEMLELFNRAAGFMQKARSVQAESNRKQGGRKRIPALQNEKIRKEAEGSALVTAIKISTGFHGMDALFERFEEMCRRRNLALDADLRPAIIRLLAAELFSNAEVLARNRPKTLLSYTLHHGAEAYGMVHSEAFRQFQGVYQWIFTHAAIYYPAHPEGFLKRVQEKILDLESNPEFSGLQKTPGLYRRAAVHHHGNSEEYLRNLMAQIDRLKRNPKFADLCVGKHVGLFMKAALERPSNPEKRLTELLGRLSGPTTDVPLYPL